jgi:hypothetical protein
MSLKKYYTSRTIHIETGAVLSEQPFYCDDSLEWRCDRSVNAASKANAKTAGDTATGFGANASQERSSVIPGLEREANNPTGYAPTDLNSMTVASEQAAGGANSGITGQANLTAARTRNAGGFGAALDEASRNKTRALSGDALSVQNKNADVKQQQQKFAQGQLTGMVGQDSNSMLKAMGIQNEDLGTAVGADKIGWVQNFTDIMNALKPGGGGGGGAGAGAGGG